MRRLATIAIVSLLVAACGSSTTSGSPAASGAGSSPTVSAGSATAGSATPGSPTVGSAAPSNLPESSIAPDASSGPGSSAAVDFPDAPDASAAADATASPAPSMSAACTKLTDAITTIDLYTQLLSQVDASNWSDLTGPDSPVGFKLATLDKAITAIASYPGTKALAANAKEIAALTAIALKDPAPFSARSSAGRRLTDAVTRLFVPIGVAMQALRTAQACPAS
jgi:hypothetical protein